MGAGPSQQQQESSSSIGIGEAGKGDGERGRGRKYINNFLSDVVFSSHDVLASLAQGTAMDSEEYERVAKIRRRNRRNKRNGEAVEVEEDSIRTFIPPIIKMDYGTKKYALYQNGVKVTVEELKKQMEETLAWENDGASKDEFNWELSRSTNSVRLLNASMDYSTRLASLASLSKRGKVLLEQWRKKYPNKPANKSPLLKSIGIQLKDLKKTVNQSEKRVAKYRYELDSIANMSHSARTLKEDKELDSEREKRLAYMKELAAHYDKDKVQKTLDEHQKAIDEIGDVNEEVARAIEWHDDFDLDEELDSLLFDDDDEGEGEEEEDQMVEQLVEEEKERERKLRSSLPAVPRKIVAEKKKIQRRQAVLEGGQEEAASPAKKKEAEALDDGNNSDDSV